MIEFKALVMKAETGDMHTIFLLKKNVWMDIIKTILEYPPMIVLEILREWKVAIILVGQKYDSTESWQDYRTGIEMTYEGKDISINIEKAKDNFNKNRRQRYFNYNTYRHIAKECQRLKKEWNMRKCYKCDKVGYIAKDYRLGQKMKNLSV